MRNRFLLLLTLAVAAASVSTSIEAGWLKRWSRDARRNNAWPHPFLYPDRAAVNAPLAIMTQKGWKQQNTLTDHHFDEKDAINEAGKLKVQWILTSAPVQYRQIYVQRGRNPEHTALRLESTQIATSELLIDQAMPEIAETGVAPPSWPANYVDSIDRKFHDSTPDPRLPEPQNNSNGTSSSSN